jgi:hypothetical protein
MIHGVL